MDAMRDDPFVVVAYGLDESRNKAWPAWDEATAGEIARDAARDPAFTVVRIHDWASGDDATVLNRCEHPAGRVRDGVCQVCGALA